MIDVLGAAAMERLMARFDPFGPAPVLAVGVSGGPDSLALAILADLWAKPRGGRVMALTVDHGLRRESADEARQVASWLGGRGIQHVILDWKGPKPATGVQAAARHARMTLLGDRCRTGGILHLLLAHHRGDQAETVALRREDRSGPDGLAAMPAETATGWGRTLRPFLAQPKSALTGFLSEIGQPWIEDPSNRNERHARVRLRRCIAEEASEAGLAASAHAHGLQRVERERAVAEALARHVTLNAAGWARCGRALLDLPDDLARAALARVVVTVGNLDYPPRSERLNRLLAHLRSGVSAPRTLGGCRILPSRDGWLVVRESSSLPPEVPFTGAATWDRFAVSLPAGLVGNGLRLGPLGSAARPATFPPVPSPARPALAAVHDLDGVVTVPHLRWVRPGADLRLRGATAWAFPRQALASAEFAVA
jgi:tRNA(Ile)-lysidine synthase